ncbi:hypothetical protein [Alteribacter natronophilus]|uniref:hypothetical protein n=1 Tax=Alteribacter natronophilus TaxID=2583810 RepID=UPI00110E5B77|nr:hypothetical protein [Alteribacter natronophilus]TMW70538.1 hypothetical protein FGB90_15210 [Alteribacter natronophilus]
MEIMDKKKLQLKNNFPSIYLMSSKLKNRIYKVLLRIYFISRKVWNSLYFTYMRTIRGYKDLQLEEDIKNGIFKIFISSDRKTIVKVIRKDNIFSYNMAKRISSADQYFEYSNLLKEMSKEAGLGMHVATVNKVWKSGSYTSPFLEGENLAVVMIQEERGRYHQDPIILINAIERFLINIKKVSSTHVSFGGDWMLHNLVFSKERNEIINIDVEGFYTYKRPSKQNNVYRLEEDLLRLKNLLKRNKEQEVSRQ